MERFGSVEFADIRFTKRENEIKQNSDNNTIENNMTKEADEHTALKPKYETFDDMLPCVGDFGRYQWLIMLSLIPFSVSYAVLYFAQFFLTLVPQEHWCKIDELQNFTIENRIIAGIPRLNEYPYYDTCHRKDLNFTNLLKINKNFHSSLWKTNRTIPCERWEYNFTQIPYASIGAELDWVCERSYLISTAQAIFFCGSIIGGFLFGWIADHKGRIPAVVYCNIAALIATIASANTGAFWSFAICRFFSGFAFDNVINIPLIIVMEYVAVKRRTMVVNVAFGVYFAIASTAIPWIAYYVANWRYFAYVISVPFFLSLVTPWILPESARWFISNGKIDQVLMKLRKIAKINGMNPHPRVYEIFTLNVKAAYKEKESATLLHLFKTPRLAKNIILLVALWTLTVIAFDGHVYSLKLLKTSVFVSFSLACATELPAGLLLTLLLDRWGRRFCAFITMTLTMLFSYAELILVHDTAVLTMSVLARFCLNMAANVGLQYAAELLPTPVRAQGIALIHIFGICAHSVAPYVTDTAVFWTGMPMAIIGTVSLICAILALFLPETTGRHLPQTLEQGENFGKDQKFWSLPCCGSDNKY
ncbi:carcinine transporter-like isoform X1 [Leptopilina boulardi]|uniref:carcinine transporter-like isoform X1 n=2 Tax=Leptopilina boulardi TaxID=63433 RepID=UPI0021F5E38F|nr:carcinine transporter-like isoform X1 [Leptopilina boulardi]